MEVDAILEIPIFNKIKTKSTLGELQISFFKVMNRTFGFRFSEMPWNLNQTISLRSYFPEQNLFIVISSILPLNFYITSRRTQYVIMLCYIELGIYKHFICNLVHLFFTFLICMKTAKFLLYHFIQIKKWKSCIWHRWLNILQNACRARLHSEINIMNWVFFLSMVKKLHV